MPLLLNARHERFAQAVADGEKLENAHEIAGFKRDRKNASHLRQRDDVSRRIAEILSQRADAANRTVAKATERAAISKADVLRMLIEDRDMAREKNQLGPAVRATELLGKELGMFIDRQLRKETDDIFETMEDAELRRLVAERARQLEADESDDATRH